MRANVVVTRRRDYPFAPTPGTHLSWVVLRTPSPRPSAACGYLEPPTRLDLSLVLAGESLQRVRTGQIQFAGDVGAVTVDGTNADEQRVGDLL